MKMHELSFDTGPYYMDHRFIEPDEIFDIEPVVTKNVIRGLVDDGKSLRAFPRNDLCVCGKCTTERG